MRICHLTSAHPWTDTRIIEKQCRSLTAAGHEVFLVAVGEPPPGMEPVQAVSVPALTGGRAGRMSLQALRVWRAALSLGADVYHFHDPELLPGALLARLTGRRVIYDVHEEVHLDIRTKFYLHPWVRSTLSLGYLMLEQLSAPLFSALMAANESTRERLGRHSARVTYVPNYPLRDEIVPAPLGGPRHGVAYVGAITRDRGIREMVAAAAVAGVRLVLAGKFENATLQAEITAMPEWANVDFCGQASRAQVARILGEVSAGLVLLHPDPNNMACLSTKLLEYMSAGIPVIASDFPSYRRVVEPFRCGLCVPPLSVHDIATAIRRLNADPALAGAMGARGRAAIESQLNWEATVPGFLQAYRRVLHSTGSWLELPKDSATP